MRVRMIRNVRGVAPFFAKGATHDVDSSLAQKWIDQGLAVPANGAVETSSVAPPERAVRKRGRPRKVQA